MDVKSYNFPKNYEKMKNVQIFFEKKIHYDEDVKRVIETLKSNFIKQRLKILKPFYEEIFTSINNSSKNIYLDLAEVIKYTICEIFYFITIFQTNLIDNTYIIQNLTSDIYDNLYNTLRPIIVSSDSLDELFRLIDGLSENFGLFFLDTEDRDYIINYFRNLDKSIFETGKSGK